MALMAAGESTKRVLAAPSINFGKCLPVVPSYTTGEIRQAFPHTIFLNHDVHNVNAMFREWIDDNGTDQRITGDTHGQLYLHRTG